jgi:hypothetical protein
MKRREQLSTVILQKNIDVQNNRNTLGPKTTFDFKNIT